MAIYIEKGTNYAYTIERIKNIRFRSLRSVSVEFTKKLPYDLSEEVYDSIQHGVCKLQSEPELNMYFHALGLMHEAKLQHAFKHLPEDFAKNPTIDIIDYGCGQAIGTICYADFLRETGKSQNVRRVILIEPSELALKRAALHVSCFFPKAEIITILKGFDDLTTNDIIIDESIPTLHIFSNVIDLADDYFNLETFGNLIQNCSIGENLYICIEPYFYNEEQDEKVERFIKLLDIDVSYSEIFLKGEFVEGHEWTCQVVIGKSFVCALDTENPNLSINKSSFDLKIDKLIIDGYKKLSHLKIKNVVVDKKDDCIILAFTFSTSVRGFVTEDNGKTWKKSLVNTIYIPLFAVCNTLYEDDELSLLWNILNKIVKNNSNTDLLNKLFVGADIDLLQLEVPAGEKFINPFNNIGPFSSNTEHTNIYNHDIIFSHIIKFRLSKSGWTTFDNICSLLFYNIVDDVLLIMDFANSAYIDKQYNEAFKYYKLATELGHAEAQYKLGRCFYNGDGVEQSYAEAVKWYRLAAEQGFAAAQCDLGVCFDYGKGVDKNEYEAVKWYRLAAEQGYAKAQYKLGFMLETGLGIAEDIDEAIDWYISADKLGNKRAKERLTNYNSLTGYRIEWLQKVAEHGYAKAQCDLGHYFASVEFRNSGYNKYYFYRPSYERAYNTAFEWFNKAAEQNFSEAQYELGCCYKFGLGTKEDKVVAIRWFLKAAEQGYSKAQHKLGDCFYYGYGVIKDYKKAVEWYLKSAEQGDTKAQLLLGKCYETGTGVDQDYKKAVEWYLKSAEHGETEAQYYLGKCYEAGIGVNQNYKKALEWFLRLIKDHYSEYIAKHVLYKIGNYYYNGLGIEQSYDEAIKCYRRAAEHGHKEAMFCLATCYRFGQGVKRSYSEAVKWYKKSETKEALSALGEIYNREKPISNFFNKLLFIFGK